MKDWLGVKKGIPFRGQLLALALILLAGGIGWSMYQSREQFSEGLPTAGTVVAVRRDAIGCETWIPFARKDCRLIVKIRLRIAGQTTDENLLQVKTSRFLPLPTIAAGDSIAGSCMPGGLRGHCRFEKLEEAPWVLYGGIAAILASAMAVFLTYRRRYLS